MSQQPLDLRKSISIIKRLRVVVGIAAAFGLLAGVGYAVIKPPLPSSTALVSLPTSVQSVATQVLIASSDPVLSAASARVDPPLSVAELRSHVDAKSLTQYLISITATGDSADQAEAIANAVAQSYIAYVGNQKSPVAHVTAEMFQPAVIASVPSKLQSMLVAGLVGLLAGAIVGCVLSLTIGRKDRRLRERDDIAKSIGVPVLASVPAAHPSDPKSWTTLLEGYQPPAVSAWQLRTALRYLGVLDQKAERTPPEAVGDALPDVGGPVTLTVVSLSSDPGALALGPQLAVFAASQKIPTTLVVGPQQDAGVTAALRTACAAPPSSMQLPGLLRLSVSSDGAEFAEEAKGAEFVVVVLVVDGRSPKLPAEVRTAATLIGVSAGRATAEQLARAAVAAGADGRDISGILVADPDPTDETTGRIPQLRPPRRRLPSRLKGVVTESRR